MHYEDVYAYVDGFGRFQKRIIVLACLLVIPTSYIAFAPVFLIASTEHWCKVPELDSVNCSLWNLSPDECNKAKRSFATPEKPDDPNGLSNCLRYITAATEFSLNFTNSSMEQIACDHGWEYDYSVYRKTVSQEFNLVCDDEDVVPWTSVAFYLGVLVGSFVFGNLADYFGRKRILFVALAWTITMETAGALSPNVVVFAIFRFLSGTSTTAIYILSFVYCSEMVSASKRSLVGLVLPIAWAVGYIVLAILAYLFRDWRDLTLIKTLPMLLLFIAYPFLPESPRWLLSGNRVDEARCVLNSIAKENGKQLPDHIIDEIQATYDKQMVQKTHSVLDLFRKRVIRRRMFVLFLAWLTNDLVYYGLSLSTGSLGINEFLAALMSAAVEIPAYLVFIPIVKIRGRKLPMILILVVAGVSCLVAVWTPIGWWKTALVMAAKFLITASFAIVYIFTSELLPTPVRSIGVGVCSSVARLGSILAPQLLFFTKIWQPLPQVIFGCMSLVSAVFLVFLPETNNAPMPQTLGEAEQIGKSDDNSEWMHAFSLVPSNEDEP